MRRSLGFLVTGAALLFLFSSVLLGQTTFGSLTGTITDPSGGVVPGVQVTLTNMGTNGKVVSTTNADGIYAFVNVQPGSYRIDAEKDGFKHFTRSPIDVQVQGSYRIDVAMQLGSVTQSIEVTAATPLLQPATSSLGQVIEGRAVGEMPLNGRNVFNLMSLVPSVIPQGQSQGTPTGANPFAFNNYQINGAFGNESAIVLDGVPENNGYLNLPSFVPTQDSIEEFKVQTDNLGPEWGRFAGGVMNLTTKTGTNQIHGEAYEYLRNKALNANDFFDNQAGIGVGAFTQNQFGANVGGPLYIPGVYDGRNKTFWFFSYEGFRVRQGQSFEDTVPTAAERIGDFSQLKDANGNLIQLYSPVACQSGPCAAGSNGQLTSPRMAFTGNVLTSINPTAAKLESLWPSPNAAGQQFTNVDNFVTNMSVGGDNDEYTARVDQNISDKQHMFARFSRWSNLNLSIDPFKTGVCQDRCVETFTTDDSVLDDTYSFTPTLLSDIHVGFDREAYNRSVPDAGYDLTSIGWPATLNSEIPSSLRTFPTPNVQDMSGDLFGTQGAGSVIFARDNNFYVAGDLTNIRGRHTLRGGAQFLVLQHNYSQTNIGSGIFTFDRGFSSSAPNNGTGGFGFASYLLGYPSGGNNSLPSLVAGQQAYRAFYIGDTWQATHKLTLNLGLRYEIPGAWSERFNRLSLWDLNAPSPLAQQTGLPLKGQMALVDSPLRTNANPVNTDYKQFAPRFGFAYQLGKQTVIRGGYGIFWIPSVVSWSLSPNNDPVNSVSTPYVASINGGVTPFGNFSNPFPSGVVQPPGRAPNLNQIFLNAGGAGDPYPTETPGYMQQWNFDIQRQLPGGFFLDVAYAGSRGVHLQTNNQNINQLPDSDLALGTALQATVSNPFFGLITSGPLSNPQVAAGQLLRPYPQYTGVSLAGSPWGDSIYHSFQMKVQRRFRGGGTLLAAYTNAKLITDTDSVSSWLEGSTGGVAGVLDWNNIKGSSYSLSSQDVSQRLVVSYVQNLPIGHGQKFLSGASGLADKLISGWGLDGITTFQAGFPMKLGTSQNLTNSDGGGSVPNVVAGCNPNLSGSPESRLGEWFNTACFTQPLAFTYGDESRVDPRLRIEGTNNWDVALFKTTNFGANERMGVQFRAEFFNLFNRPQFGPPGQTQGTSGFGVVSSQVNNPRLVQ
ncbi:MAG: carboxypeptidase regulatory-like domain-containing protein, partial [Terriglobia bacterium]